MDKTGLIESARTLTEASQRAVSAFEGTADACAADLTRSMKLVPDLDKIIGEGNFEVMETNHGNHFRYMCSACALFDPQSFVETVLWVLRTYRVRGFSARYWNVMLPKAMDILRTHLDPKDFQEISPFYEWLLDNMPAFVRLSETELSAYEQMGGAHGLHD